MPRENSLELILLYSDSQGSIDGSYTAFFLFGCLTGVESTNIVS